MHFLGHRRTASQQSIGEQKQQQPHQQRHHQHRLSATSALWQAAQALGSIGAPATAATAATAIDTRPPLPNTLPSSSSLSTSSKLQSQPENQHQQQEQEPGQQEHHNSHYQLQQQEHQQRQQQDHHHYLPPNHNPNHPSLTISSSPTSSPQFSQGAATATGPPVPKKHAVANFFYEDDSEHLHHHDRNLNSIADAAAAPPAAPPAATAADSASSRSLQPNHPHSYSHSHSHSYSYSHSPSYHSLSHSDSRQQRASIPPALLPVLHGQQLHWDSTYSLPAHPIATETSAPTGHSSSVTSPSTPSHAHSSSVAAMNQQPQPTQQQQQQQPPPPQQQQQQQFPPAAPRRTGTYSSQHDELHMPAGMIQHGQLSPREYSSATTSAAPQIKLDQASPSASQFQSTSSVPNVLQPGGAGGRPPAITANTAPTLASMQPTMPQQSQDYSTPSKPNLNLSHSYSRSSPAAGYEGAATFAPYTPTTPSGSGSQFMSPPDPKYNAPGSQRNISNTPLGLADIRPRADSSMSDGVPGSVAYELANAQPGTSNYLAPWALYAFDWCKWPPQGNGAGKLAVGSYLEDGHNFIQILDTQMVPTPNDVYQPGTSKYNLEFSKVAEATHSYPVTRLLWEPPSSQKQSTDLLATSGDHLRLWSLPSESPASQSNSINRQGREPAVTKLTPLALLSNSKTPDHTAPLTSLDWNTVSPSLIITSSIDTTCTIWDIPSLTAKTQLIAHDKEVYDVRFCANSVDVFVSCGQDGSVRMFDLRSLEHSTIIYEPTGKDERGILLSDLTFQRALLTQDVRYQWRAYQSHSGAANHVQPSPLTEISNLTSRYPLAGYIRARL
nr:WD repeat protein [Colletotrichum truncatum]KAF6789938.1 WD repeat protein [Colletotrichum truncatum]